jgi:DtxR family Mn-dependent transcriptional regulator
MAQTDKLTPSLENYLETILFLEKKNRVARVKDIAEMMSVQMPSVTGALKNLKARNLINYQKNSYISLTDDGLDVANAVQNRHTLLSAFLEKILALSREDAEEEACKIEHVISPETARRIQNLTTYIEHAVFGEGGVSEKKWQSILSPKPDL